MCYMHDWTIILPKTTCWVSNNMVCAINIPHLWLWQTCMKTLSKTSIETCILCDCLRSIIKDKSKLDICFTESTFNLRRENNEAQCNRNLVQNSFIIKRYTCFARFLAEYEKMYYLATRNVFCVLFIVIHKCVALISPFNAVAIEIVKS